MTMRKTVAAVERRNNTKDGNPVYRVSFADGTVATTASDAADAYGITGDEAGSDVDVEFDDKGRIADWKP